MTRSRAITATAGIVSLILCGLWFDQMDGILWLGWSTLAFYGAVAVMAAIIIPEVFE